MSKVVVIIDGVSLVISEQTSRLAANAIAAGRISYPHSEEIKDEMFDFELLLNSAQPQPEEALGVSSIERR